MRDLAVGVVPDFRPGRAIVSRGILRVVVLVRVKRIWGLLGDAFCGRNVMVRRSRLCRRRAHDDVGTEALEITHLFGRGLFGQNKNALISANRRHQSQPDACIT